MDDVPEADGSATVLAGRYEVGPLVGIGGTAQVHRAWDRHRGCPVAVKVFRPGAAPTPGYGGARELQVLTGVRHPGLVGVHSAGVDPQGCPFVVMDFVDGHSLSARLHDGPLPAGAVAQLGTVLADALEVVHARGVVHRDVKPANVLLDTDGHPWLTDFGIARIVDATRVTATGIVVGTAAYMAPEQVRGEAVGPAADVYALGLVLLEAVTGRREYEGGAVESALARLHRAPQVPASVPDPLAATVRAMTAPAPGDRPTAAEVAATLTDSGAVVRRAGSGRRAVPVAALAALVAAAFAGAVTLVGAGSSSEGQASVVRAAAPAPALAAPPRPLRLPDLGGAADAVDAAVAAAAPVPVALTNRNPAPGPVAAPPAAAADRDGATHAEKGGGKNTADGNNAGRHDTKGSATKSSATKSSATKSSATKSSATESSATESSATESSATKSGATKSTATKSGDNGGGKSGKGNGDNSGSGSSGSGKDGKSGDGGGHGDNGGRSGSNSGKG
jgi:hypothetical protein